MKLKHLHLALMSLLLPIPAFSLGMGDIKVDSLLNQPFHAEIPLIDVGGVSLTNIKVNIASIENFERVGLRRTEVLDLLRLTIKTNAHGQPVIDIRSTERIDDPCMQMVIDIAWANGQLYRAYTVLLDPPDYTLLRSIKHNAPRAIDQQIGAIDRPVSTSTVEQVATGGFSRGQTSYGPTLANEGIWQIAQRYSTPDTTLPQIILAIVGTNSDAFTQGNLNGLKTGARLKIPSTAEILKVPEDLARQEVNAQDAAWKAKTEIRHVLLPPYIDGVAGVSQFTEASPAPSSPSNEPIPTPPDATPAPPVPAPVAQPVLIPTGSEPVPAVKLPAADAPSSPEMLNLIESLKTQLRNSSEIIDSIRRENTTVKAQLQELQNKTAPLEKTLSEQNKAIAELHQQIQAMKNSTRITTTSDTVDRKREESREPVSVWLYLLPLLAVAGGCGLGYWARMRAREREAAELSDTEDVTAAPADEQPVLPTPPVQTTEEEIKPEYAEAFEETHEQAAEPAAFETAAPENPLPTDQKQAENTAEEPETEDEPEKPEDFILDFEPGLDKVMINKKHEPEKSDSYQDNAGIDYFIETPQPVETEKPLDEQLLFDSIVSSDEEKKAGTDIPVEESPAAVNAEKVPDDVPAQPENKLLKSTLALDTLMDLARTYISMDDFEAARHSLEEVIQFGSEEQIAEARRLLDEINDR